MLTLKDLAVAAQIGVLDASVVIAAEGLGITIPAQWAAALPLAVLVVIACVRLYVQIKGADNTTVDEALEAAEDAVAKAASAVSRSRGVALQVKVDAAEAAAALVAVEKRLATQEVKATQELKADK